MLLLFHVITYLQHIIEKRKCYRNTKEKICKSSYEVLIHKLLEATCQYDMMLIIYGLLRRHFQMCDSKIRTKVH